MGIVTHLNAPKIAGYEGQVNNQNSRVYGQEFRVFYDEKVHFYNQPLAMVVADSFERALFAASLLKIEYDAKEHEAELIANLRKTEKPKRAQDYQRGEQNAYKKAYVGFAAAVANAVYHATGKRIRELPITPDKLVRRPVIVSCRNHVISGLIPTFILVGKTINACPLIPYHAVLSPS